MPDQFRMKIEKNTVVSLRYKLTDAQNNVIEEPDTPMVYLHGGYEGTFPKIEKVLDGQDIGYEANIQLEPSEAFGEYDPDLLKIEPRARFPEPLEVGMQFEGEDETGDVILYTVTNIDDGKVVVDGNHPWAGERVLFKATVTGVRSAVEEEVAHGHVHGAGGHHH
jgi:FKBP-type peptidyl-prolyl cis-trans isomerase SlyD